MNSADGFLPPEDQADFEQILDEALRTTRLTSGADAAGIEELRELARDALPDIASAASAEYERLTALRLRLDERPDAGAGLTDAAVAPSGVGVVTVFFALVPVLAGIAGVVFLLLGYLLGVADPEPAMAEPMRTVGWVFALVAAVGLLIAAAGLVIVAARNGSTSIRASAPADHVARARDEWRRALHDNGIAPFLRQHVAALPQHEPDRTPRLRFSSPHFSSPEFSSRGGDAPSRPRYGTPDFSGPKYTSPTEGGADRE
ncbi:hypothetical protein [Streptomyces radicis]|uniref:Transmembrane protein n=1 Tax=Streptomyces radicis TaxID=1750517 RepID=A0A3A9WHS1_9ACTN|nr:hypothetical protein [Streptomyces radicis]RKN07246.1 hypothetical protein D7319_19420 [Streptomyces radicis]RKN26736.1 hypothetical protein D7318_05130 [Streptomyces radicis]